MTLPTLADVDALSDEQAQLVALSMVYAAAQLVHLLATQGPQVLSLHQAAFDALITAALSDDPVSWSRYHYPVGTQLGLRTLERCLTEPFSSSTPAPQQWRYSHTMRYTHSLLTLERQVYKRKALKAVLAQRLPVLRQRLVFFDHKTNHPALLAGLADAYSDTAGTLTHRLAIHGQADVLKQKQHIDAIRACLFAGIQAAHFWHQHGGRAWLLMFQRRTMLAQLRELAVRHYRRRPAS